MEEIKVDRGISEDDDVRLQIGIDGGGGHFKVCLNIIVDEKLKPGAPQNPKKQKKRHKYSSVRTAFILACVEKIPEHYDNVRLIMEKLQLHTEKIKFCLASDLKLINILGQSKS